MKKNAATKIVFPIYDNDGDLVTAAAALDTEYSLDGGAFGDCASEATEIGATGIYYLNVAAGETNGDVACFQVKTSTANAKTSVLVFYTSAQTLDEVDAIVDNIHYDIALLDTQVFNNHTDIGLNMMALVNLAATVDNIHAVHLPLLQTTLNTVDVTTVISRKIATNRWQLVGNQLIMYNDDQATALYTFNLVDSAGAPAMEKVYQRTPV